MIFTLQKLEIAIKLVNTHLSPVMLKSLVLEEESTLMYFLPLEIILEYPESMC